MRVLLKQKFDHEKKVKIAVKVQNNGEPKICACRIAKTVKGARALLEAGCEYVVDG